MATAIILSFLLVVSAATSTSTLAVTPGPEEGSQTRPRSHEGGGAHTDETDDATTHHPFDNVAQWVRVFDDPTRAEWQKPEELVKALGLEKGMSVADIGAGTGYFNRFLSRAVGAEGKVYAVDTEPEMVAHMKERAEKEGTPNVIPLLAEPADPKLPEGSVDRILIVDTYHHFDDRLQYFDRLKGALKPGGLIAIVDFKYEPLPVGPRREHKLPRGQIVGEMEVAGFRLVREPDFLPYQNYLIFAPR
jgi:cyclopropane fatty-acyl-phospholipid synthase-like methyltransferase